MRVASASKIAGVVSLLLAGGHAIFACSSDNTATNGLGADGGNGDGGVDGSINPSPPPPDAGDAGGDGATLGPDSVLAEKTTTIAAATGGTVTADDGASITIPANALAADTAITIKRWKNPLPPPVDGRSNRYEFLPEGTQFKMPVSVTIPFDGSADAIFLWTAAAGGYENANGKITGKMITGRVTHFSSGGASGKPICPTQGGNTFCRQFGLWNCCYGSQIAPDAVTSFCFDPIHDDHYCVNCDPFYDCAAKGQQCVQIGPATSTCE